MRSTSTLTLSVLILLSASAVAVALDTASAGPAAAVGTALVTESFTGSSVTEGTWRALGSACLTGATAPAAAGTLGACTSSNHAPATGSTPGFLQLTDDSGYTVGGVLSEQAFPGNGGVVVAFDQWQYGGNGADGIGFFLTDGSADLSSAGGNGGSLGYAPINLTPGVAKGYLGVGLDSYGNYTNPTERRDHTCSADQTGPGMVPNTVSLRGPGDGTTGYCWLAGTVGPDGRSTLPGSLRGTDASTASARSVRITVAPESRPLVTVEIDFHDGTGWREVFSHRMDVDAPATYKLGLLASTGGLTDTHLIRNLSVSSVEPLGQINLSAQIEDPAEHYAVGDRIRYRYLVSNTSTLAPLTDVRVDDPGAPDAACPRSDLGRAGSTTASMTCTGTHVVTADDARSDSYTSAARASGADGANSVTSTPVALRAAIVRDVAALDLDVVAALADTDGDAVADVGEVVTTSYTVTNTGTRTLRGVDVAATLPGAVQGGPLAVLEPGVSAAFSGAHTVTDDDVRRGGSLVDEATATATDDDGRPAQATASSASIPLAAGAEAVTPPPSPTPSPEPAPGGGATTAPAPVPSAAATPGVVADPGPSATGGLSPATAPATSAETAPGRLAWTGANLTAAALASLALLVAGTTLVVGRARPRR